MYVYKITNKLNGKIYIGQAANVAKRWSRHCKNTDKAAISLAIRKHGKHNFSFDIITEYDNELDLNNAEDYFIDFYNTLAPSGYNRVTGQQKNRVWLEESLNKASESKKGEKNPSFGIIASDVRKKAISDALKGKPKSPEHRAKIKLINLGRKHTIETRAKMSASAKNSINPGRFTKGKNKWL